jgi:hypothetical protein
MISIVNKKSGWLLSIFLITAYLPLSAYPVVKGVTHKNYKQTQRQKKQNSKNKFLASANFAKNLQYKDEKQKQLYVTKLDRIFKQFSAVRAERQRLENGKIVLLNEFAKRETAFVANLAKYDNSCKQSILLAMSSKSLSDFVHESIAMNYLQLYIACKNQPFMNFIKNINQINNQINYYARLEKNLITKWNEEKSRFDLLYKKNQEK